MFRQLNEELQAILEARTIGNYTLQYDVIMSPQVEKFLLDVSKQGGKGFVSSCVRNSKSTSIRSHASGNKFDLLMGDVKHDQQAAIQKILPILRHPKCRELAFECFGTNTATSTQIAESMKATIMANYPDIAARVRSGKLKIWTDWGWQHSDACHVDVCIYPN